MKSLSALTSPSIASLFRPVAHAVSARSAGSLPKDLALTVARAVASAGLSHGLGAVGNALGGKASSRVSPRSGSASSAALGGVLRRSLPAPSTAVTARYKEVADALVDLASTAAHKGASAVGNALGHTGGPAHGGGSSGLAGKAKEAAAKGVSVALEHGAEHVAQGIRKGLTAFGRAGMKAAAPHLPDAAIGAVAPWILDPKLAEHLSHVVSHPPFDGGHEAASAAGEPAEASRAGAGAGHATHTPAAAAANDIVASIDKLATVVGDLKEMLSQQHQRGTLRQGAAAAQPQARMGVYRQIYEALKANPRGALLQRFENSHPGYTELLGTMLHQFVADELARRLASRHTAQAPQHPPEVPVLATPA